MLEQAPYLKDFGPLAAGSKAEHNPLLFVSAPGPATNLCRYSIAVTLPISIIYASEPTGPITLEAASQPVAPTEFAEFGDASSAAMGQLKPLDENDRTPWPAENLPFLGGLAGFLSYESGVRFEIMPTRRKDPPSCPQPASTPEIWFGLYSCGYIADHETKEGWIVHRGVDSPFADAAARGLDALREWIDTATSPTEPLPEGDSVEPDDWRSDWEASLDRASYGQAIDSIGEYLRAGDIYQANLTVRYRKAYDSKPSDLFRRLLVENPAPFMAFFQSPDWSVFSSSPELFLDLAESGKMETRPIKGTIRDSAEDDRGSRDALLASAKDGAEHIMIVDLERNDLGRIAEIGSIRVDPLMQIESYRGLHHLVSSVRGQLRDGLGPVDAIASLFPGGSITGAPKIRALQIIHELEPVPRGIYTGAIGWITPEGACRMSLAIRTMIQHGRVLDLHVGGGIVADSDADLEYEECRVKGTAMAKAVAQVAAKAPVTSAQSAGASSAKNL